MGDQKIVSFETRFNVWLPDSLKISSNNHNEEIHHHHEPAWTIVRLLAYMIDIGLIVLIVPIPYLLYHYLKWWQTIGQLVLWIRVYRDHHWTPEIATISQLIIRIIVKLMFLVSWAIWWATLINTILGRRPTYTDDPLITVVYYIVMILWIHGYALPIFISPQSLGMHDTITTTLVAYDVGPSFKRIVIALCIVSILCYLILVVWPILSTIEHTIYYTIPMDYYWSFWSWIDYWVLRGIYVFWLANH